MNLDELYEHKLSEENNSDEKIEEIEDAQDERLDTLFNEEEKVNKKSLSISSKNKDPDESRDVILQIPTQNDQE